MTAIQNLIGVLSSPSKTYESLRAKPSWLLAAVVLIVVALVGQMIALPKIDFEEISRAQIEASNRQLTEAQIEQSVEIGAKFGSIMAMVSVIAGFPIGWALIALLMWVLVRMMGGLDLSYVQSLSTTVHSMAPWIVHSILTIPLLLTRSEITPEDIQTGGVLKHGLGAFIESEGATQQALNSINVFSIWTVVLLGIGFSVVGKISKGKAFAAAIALWVVGILFKVLGASLGG